MLTPLRRFALPAAAAAAMAGLASPTLAATPIRPNQSFLGQVNGSRSDAVVTVVCAGPIWPGRTGPPVSGQKVSVALSPALAGPGYTGGVGTRVVVRFDDDPTIPAVLRSYDTAAAIPTGLRLPCGGTGLVHFTPKPTSHTARADDVKVTYENIAL